MNRKKVLIAGFVAAAISAVACYFIFAEKGEELPDPVDFYTAGDERIESVTNAVEDVGDELLLSVSTSEDEAADKENKPDEDSSQSDEDTSNTENENDGKDNKNAGEKIDTKQENVSGSQGADLPLEQSDQEKENILPWSKYYYRISVDSTSDIEKYTEFLTENGFEKVETETEEILTNKEEQEPKENTLSGKYQRDAAEEGYIFCLEIEFPLADDPETGLYKIEASIIEKPEPEKHEAVTRESAKEYMEGINYKALGLDRPISDYYVVLDMGRSYINGKDCYGINVYNKGKEGESYFVKKYYMSLDDKDIYVYDIDGVIEKLDQQSGSFKGINKTTDTFDTGGEVTEDNSPVDSEVPFRQWKLGPLDSE